jgi:hypothetical protein
MILGGLGLAFEIRRLNRAIALLATAGRNGATRPLLTAHGFGVSMIAGLVNQGLATIRRQAALEASAACTAIRHQGH